MKSIGSVSMHTFGPAEQLAVEAMAAAVRVVAAALRRFPSTQAPIVAAAARQEEEGLITVRW